MNECQYEIQVCDDGETWLVLADSLTENILLALERLQELQTQGRQVRMVVHPPQGEAFALDLPVPNPHADMVIDFGSDIGPPHPAQEN